jgi:threonine dehydratase
VNLDTIREAARSLRAITAPTPLVEVGVGTAAEVGATAPLFLKCEHLQPIGAFKIRGAYTAIRRLPEAERRRGVVTSSSGNHGQAVAWAGRHFGIASVVVMPESAPEVKVAGVRRHGGEVVFAGAVRSPEQQARAEALSRERGLVFIPPFDHADVIAGQGTVGLELLEQVPLARTVLVPVGGGGLLSGIVTALADHPGIEVVGVEPARAAKLTRALAAGRPEALPETGGIADGLLTRAIGTLPWALIAGRVQRALTVTDEEIGSAVRWLFRRQGLRVEPSGAVTVAAWLGGAGRTAGATVAVLSGGNVDPELFERLVTA